METIYWHWPVYCKGSHKGLNDEMRCSLQACHPLETSRSSERWHMQRPHYSGRTWNPSRWWSFTQSSSCPRGSGGARSPKPQMSPKFVQVTSLKLFRGCQPSVTSLVYKNLFTRSEDPKISGVAVMMEKKSNRYFSTITSKQFSSQVMHARVTQRSENWGQSTGSSRPSWAQEDTVWKKEKIAWKFAKQVELVQTYYCVL